MIGYFEVNKNIRFLQINDNFLTIDLFKGQKIELSYVDIVSVQITKDLYLGEVFEFFLKTGNKYKIRSQIKNKHQALELIQKRLINK
jgi:ribosome-binding factor A